MEDHNERFRRGLETYEMGINEFSDYTEEEMKAHTGIEMPLEMPNPLVTNIIDSNSAFELLEDVPSSLDWRSKGVITPVKHQGNCGSCWAFAANGALEAHYKIRTNSTVILSEQQLVDCVVDNHGCKGGWPTKAFIYVAENGGINLQADYPYEAKDGQCRYNASKPLITLKWYTQIAPDEELLKNMVATKRPFAVAIDSEGNFGSYKSGVYYNASCSSRASHAVVVVGYGTENGQDYWLVKNSWGPNWGQDGYIKMARNRGNNCLIATYAAYPVFSGADLGMGFMGWSPGSHAFKGLPFAITTFTVVYTLLFYSQFK